MHVKETNVIRWKRGLSAVAAATLSLAVSTPTWASVTHYYGVAVWFNAPQNAGTEANPYISSGSAADWSASYAGFIAQVLWEGTSNNGDYWVEAGYIYGWQQQNIATWYWADNRPTYGYDEHQITSVPVTVGATMPVDIVYQGNDTWSITINDSAKNWRSTDNPPYSEYMSTGLESASPNSVLDGAYSSGMAYANLNYPWISSWGSGTELHNDSPANVAWVNTYKKIHDWQSYLR